MHYLLLFSAVLSNECQLDIVKTCLSKYLPLVSPEGINLTWNNVREACKSRKETKLCLQAFSDDCSPYLDEQQNESLKNAQKIIGEVCRKRSLYMPHIISNEYCFKTLNTSLMEFYTDRVYSSDMLKFLPECLKYKLLKDHVTNTGVNICDESSHKVILYLFESINGIIRSMACEQLFQTSTSPNSSDTEELLEEKVSIVWKFFPSPTEVPPLLKLKKIDSSSVCKRFKNKCI